MDVLVPPFGELLKSLRIRNGFSQRTLAIRLGVHRNTVGFWERGDVLPSAKAKVLELAAVLRLNYMETHQLLEASLTSVVFYWYLPFPQNPFFTGRNEVLRTLHEHLIVYTETVMPICAIQGVAGIGKTQVAIEYAYRYAAEYTALLWIDAQTPETMHASLRHIAGVLQLPGWRDSSPPQLMEAVQQWLSSHTQWLLIWDHLEDLDLLWRFLPSIQQRFRKGSLGMAQPTSLPTTKKPTRTMPLA